MKPIGYKPDELNERVWQILGYDNFPYLTILNQMIWLNVVKYRRPHIFPFINDTQCNATRLDVFVKNLFAGDMEWKVDFVRIICWGLIKILCWGIYQSWKRCMWSYFDLCYALCMQCLCLNIWCMRLCMLYSNVVYFCEGNDWYQ